MYIRRMPQAVTHIGRGAMHTDMHAGCTSLGPACHVSAAARLTAAERPRSTHIGQWQPHFMTGGLRQLPSCSTVAGAGLPSRV